jgi:hypothetical protein
MSTGECFQSSAWENAALSSRFMTSNCVSVLYSVALGRNVSNINGVQLHWHGHPCSLMFISKSSRFIQKEKYKNLERVKNWTLILVDDLPEYSSMRRAGKIPKFSPLFFFSRKVKYAIYLDSKFKLFASPAWMIHQFASSNSNVILSALRHPKNKNLTMELQNIRRSSNFRPSISDDLEKVTAQYEYYTNHVLFQKLAKKKLDQTVVEAGMLIHKLKDKRASILRCAWLDEVQRHSDRDQVAFPFIAAIFNKYQPPISEGQFTLLPLEFSKSNAYVNVLPTYYSWTSNNASRLGSVRYEDWHLNAEILSPIDQNQGKKEE